MTHLHLDFQSSRRSYHENCNLEMCSKEELHMIARELDDIYEFVLAMMERIQ